MARPDVAAPADATALATLRWFVFRARRVAEHSLVADRERLLKWAQGSMKLTVVPGGESTFSIDLPDEEPFESLAGRVRPFMMLRDDLHFKKVLEALRSYVLDDPEKLATVEDLVSRWSRFDPKSKETLGYAMRTGDVGEPLGSLVPDTTLADAWLYCDFGHGDTNVRDRVGAHGLDSRLQAAVLLVSNMAVAAVMTLNVIRAWWRGGLIPLEDNDFSERVLARTESTAQLARMATAPVGTPIDQLGAMLDQAASDRGQTS